MRKESASHLEKGLQMSLEQDESEQETGEDENNNTDETTRIPQITTEELQTAMNKLK